MKKNKFLILVISNITASFLALTAIIYTYKNNLDQANFPPQITQGLERDISLAAFPIKNGEIIPSLAPIIKEITPAIVNISTKGKITLDKSPLFQNPFFQDPFFERFFKFNTPNSPVEKEVQSIGSGVIIDSKNGYIITNHHVIKDAETIYITLLNKKRLEAKLIGSDPETDIAILKVDHKNLTQITIGKSDNLEVGDFTLAIGNPFGLGHTVTSGIVSALGRSGLGLEGYEDFIQTDASINPGNSGGALINLKGELIGINAAILSKSGGNVGIGFAIPIDMAYSIMKQLIEDGEVSRGQIGVQIQNLSPDIIEAMGLNVSAGALVAGVTHNSPAEKAGIKAGDIIVSVNNNKITGSSNLRNIIGTLPIGTKIEIGLIQDNIQKNVKLIIEKKQKKEETEINTSSSETAFLKGVKFQDTNNGVVVYEIEHNSRAYYSGLRKGDLILHVNRTKVNSSNELFKAVKQNQKGALIKLQRQNDIMFIVIHR